MTATVTDSAAVVDWATATVILQLFDDSIYMVSEPRGEKTLLRKDRIVLYHIEGSLAVADKVTIKDLVARLGPLFKQLGNCR
jgi:hypothetical protein